MTGYSEGALRIYNRRQNHLASSYVPYLRAAQRSHLETFGPCGKGLEVGTAIIVLGVVTDPESVAGHVLGDPHIGWRCGLCCLVDPLPHQLHQSIIGGQDEKPAQGSSAINVQVHKSMD